MGVSNVPAASSSGVRPKYQKFTSSGTFTLPTGYGAANPLVVDVLVIGGGGGGAWASGPITVYGNFTFNQGFFSGSSTGAFQNKISANALDWTNNINVGAGGSGGVAATKMSLTSNVSVTVGAKGTRGASIASTNAGSPITINESFPGNTNGTWEVTYGITSSQGRGNAGGTSTVGSVSASGGNAAQGNYSYDINIGYSTNVASQNLNANTMKYSTSTATGGQPAGTSADTTPLLGAIAGGSSSTTAVFGSSGVGGKKGDGTTSTGVDGTGGGLFSDAASGAVIFTWWE